jgi:hypothetical protein
MKTKSIHNKCTTCGKKRKLTPLNGSLLCSTCQSLVDLLQNNPDCIQQLSELASVSFASEPQPKQVEQELPEVLDAVRYRTTDRERNTWYVSISELAGDPVEIFASTAFDRDQHLQSRISNLTTITRLISLILRHIFMGERITLGKTLTQLHRSSRQPNDLPDMLGKVLSNYNKKVTSPEEGSNTVTP